MFVKSISAATVALALLTGVASAQSINAGHAQLAAEAHVDPAAYTSAQIYNLIQARREGDVQTANFILAQAGGVSSRADTTGTVFSAASGKAQLAAELHVNADQYTLSQLTAMIADKDVKN